MHDSLHHVEAEYKDAGLHGARRWNQHLSGDVPASEINLARAAFGDDSPETLLVGEVEHLPENKNHVGNWTVDGVTVTVSPQCNFDFV